MQYINYGLYDILKISCNYSSQQKMLYPPFDNLLPNPLLTQSSEKHMILTFK